MAKLAASEAATAISHQVSTEPLGVGCPFPSVGGFSLLMPVFPLRPSRFWAAWGM